MALTKRTTKGSPLSIEEMDANLDYLATNLSGSTVTISGSVNLSGSLSVNGTQVGGSSYTVYSALISQTGTNAPVATILENTIGSIVWTRTGAGNYEATLVGAFPLNKTAIVLGKNYTLSTAAIDPYDVLIDSYGSTDVLTLNSVVNGAGLTDGKIKNMFIEIRVYP